MSNKKLKVAWICAFSNEQVRANLPLNKHRLVNSIKRLFDKPPRNAYSDFAAWVTNSIAEFEKFEDVELHVISPHRFMTKLSSRFFINNIYYYFYKQDIPLIHRPVPVKKYLGLNPQVLYSRYFVRKTIKLIKPDIVNLVGSEYPPKAITALDIRNIPIYVSMQTVYNNPLRYKYSSRFSKYRAEIEQRVFKHCNYYGCGGRMHYDLVKNYKPEADVFKLFFPRQRPDEVKYVEKEFDFVFFAGLHKKKGVEDLIEALTIVKEEKTDVSLNIIGGTKGEYVGFLKHKINTLGLSENIVFSQRFATYQDLFQHLVKSRFATLPVKLDSIPSSVNEAMYLGLPVVTYRTTGMPFLNKDGETVLMSDIGDIQALADNMLKLLKSTELAEKLAKDAKQFVNREFDNTKNAKKLVADYRAVIDNYHNNTPIPRELLFNIEEFPIY